MEPKHRDKIIMLGLGIVALASAFVAFRRKERTELFASSGDTCPPVTKKGDYATDPKAIKELEECIDDLPQTKTLNTKGGKYTKERMALHKKIINEVSKDNVCVDPPGNYKPIAILTGGVPGSGKSTFIREYAPWMKSDKIFLIDADEIRAKLPEYDGWNASQTHMETRDIVYELLDDIGKPCKTDVLYDGTMNKAKKYEPLVERLKSLGYDVYIIFMDVPAKVSKQRVKARYKQSGRYVPQQVVDEVNKAGLSAFNKVRQMVDGWILVDGQTQEILGRGGKRIPRNRFWEKGKATMIRGEK